MHKKTVEYRDKHGDRIRDHIRSSLGKTELYFSLGTKGVSLPFTSVWGGIALISSAKEAEESLSPLLSPYHIPVQVSKDECESLNHVMRAVLRCFAPVSYGEVGIMQVINVITSSLQNKNITK